MVPRGFYLLRNATRCFVHPVSSSSTRWLSFLSATSNQPHCRIPTLSTHWQQIRCSSTEEFDSDSVSVEAAESLNAKDGKEDGIISSEAFRSFLYPEEDHPLFLQLNQCNSVQEVFVFLHKHQDELSPVLVSQAVMVLWDLQRIFLKFCIEEYTVNSIHELRNYIKKVNGHPDFDSLLRSVGNNINGLNPDALTCVLLYLGKMGVMLNHPVMQKLLEKCSKEFSTYPMTAISRFLVASQQGNSMKTLYITKDILPILLQKIKTIEDAEDFRLITICFSHLVILFTKRIFDLYIAKTQELMEKGVIGSHTPKAVVKALNLINFNRVFKPDPNFVRSVLCLLEGNVHTLRSADIISLNRSLQHNLETAALVNEVEEYINTCLAEQDPHTLSVDLLNCSMSRFTNADTEKLIEEHIKSDSFNLNSISIFKLLRNSKTSNRELCDLYWHKVAGYLSKNPKDMYTLMTLSYNYMHFNNNLGGTYRNERFESTALDCLLDLMRSPYRYVTTVVSRSVAFLLGYSKEGVPAEVLSQVLNLEGQFSSVDCHNLSRGIRVATNLKNGTKSPVLLDQIVKISSVISSCIRFNLNCGAVDLTTNDSLMRTYQNIQGVVGTDLHEKLLQNYSKVTFKDMSGRVIRDLSNTFISNKCLIPATVNIMEDYVIKAGPALLGNTAERFIYMLYFLGYSSPKAEESIQTACNVIIRDSEMLDVLSILTSALALNFYQQLPLDFTQFIFTVEFLDRVDKELKSCYARAVYPVRVRQMMMELNRAVCLDCPQADIPWFHEQFCQENAFSTSYQSALHTEVYNTLCQVAGGSEFVRVNSYTAYYYNLNFEIILDENEKPLNLKHFTETDNKNYTRVAIIINRDSHFTNGVVQLCGPALLRKRHLEMLGYRQVEISRFIWQAMYMSEEASRQKFISEQIWPHRRKSDDHILHSEDLAIS